MNRQLMMMKFFKRCKRVLFLLTSLFHLQLATVESLVINMLQHQVSIVMLLAPKKASICQPVTLSRPFSSSDRMHLRLYRVLPLMILPTCISTQLPLNGLQQRKPGTNLCPQLASSRGVCLLRLDADFALTAEKLFCMAIWRIGDNGFYRPGLIKLIRWFQQTSFQSVRTPPIWSLVLPAMLSYSNIS